MAIEVISRGPDKGMGPLVDLVLKIAPGKAQKESVEVVDDDEQWMSLRYDLTAPLARFAAEHWDTLPKPFRRFAYGPVWRNEKPGPGRFREFMQCDADTVGAKAPPTTLVNCSTSPFSMLYLYMLNTPDWSEEKTKPLPSGNQ